MIRKKILLLFVLCFLFGNIYAQKISTNAETEIWQKASDVTLPESIDLTSELTEVKHQGRRNTCSAFAATALMEYLIKKQTGKTLDLSESYNYWSTKNHALYNDYLKKVYSHMDGMAGFLAVYAYQYGATLEKDWPYEAKNWFQLKDPRCQIINGIPDTKCFTGTPPAKIKILPYKIKPVFIKLEDISSYILAEKKPVVVNISWYPKSVESNGNVRIPTKEEKSPEYGHVILLVGYNSVSKTFIFRNSWGSRWGRNGYGILPEKYILEYYEMAKFQPFEQYPPNVKKFCIKGSMGVSGELFIDK